MLSSTSPTPDKYGLENLNFLASIPLISLLEIEFNGQKISAVCRRHHDVRNLPDITILFYSIELFGMYFCFPIFPELFENVPRAIALGRRLVYDRDFFRFLLFLIFRLILGLRAVGKG